MKLLWHTARNLNRIGGCKKFAMAGNVLISNGKNDLVNPSFENSKIIKNGRCLNFYQLSFCT